MATMSARYTVIDGEVIAQERGGVRHQLVPDPLGSTVALYDNAGTKTDTFGYWPYGESSGRVGSTTLKFQFVGSRGYYQDKQNQNYIRARYLYLGVGRWTSEDPIGYLAGDINLYRYVKNKTISFIDPSGLYYRYCGPQTTTPCDNKGNELPPLDDFDSCCKKHDDCFAGKGCTALNQSFVPGCGRCTMQLCKCLKNNLSLCTVFGQTLKCYEQRLSVIYACGIIFWLDLNPFYHDK